MSRTRFFQYTLFIVLLSSCNSNRWDVDVSAVNLSLDAHRFDHDVLEICSKNQPTAYQKVFQSYGEFADTYFTFILQLGETADSATLATFCDIMHTDSLLIKTQQAIDAVHDNETDHYRSQLEDAFRHYRFHFPEERTPELIFMNGWFNYAVVPSDSVLAIGLEFFLVPDHPITQLLPPENFPRYFRAKMRPDYVVTDAMRGWIMVKHQGLMQQGKFINELIWYGKMMVVLDACMPEVADSLKIGYSANELAWCKESETSIWKEMARQDVMFQSNQIENNKWFADGPFTRVGNVPQDSPSRLGLWMGWQIVRDYMNKNPEVTLQQLLEESNSQHILKYYDPRD